MTVQLPAVLGGPQARAGGPTSVHLFAGGGGDVYGTFQAGFTPVAFANHSERCVETVRTNFPGAKDLCVDVSAYDMRHLPRADILVASAICTEISPAGGNARDKRMVGQAPLPIEQEPEDAGVWERTRATAWDILRAAETWDYAAVLTENVVEFATDWRLFEVWLSAWDTLGYHTQIASLNSAHLSGPGYEAVPQWRDRIYVVATKKSLPLPDLNPRPLAHCDRCGCDQDAVQTWRSARRVGKYGQAYDYKCPACKDLVEPYVRGAGEIIEWTNPGRTIRSRIRPGKPRGLVPATMARIDAGLADLALTPSTDDLPPVLVPGAESIGEPFLVVLRRNGKHLRLHQPLQALAAKGNHFGLVIPYRKGNHVTSTYEPLLTLGTRDSAGLLVPVAAPFVAEDCHFRMITNREQFRAQGFPDDFVICGSQTEATAMAGNAVSVNAARFIAERVKAIL